MRFTDIFKLSIRMFRARTSRTLLTILGMSIGIAAILFLVRLGYGLQKTLLERITTSESLLTLDVTEAKSGVVVLNKEMVEKIKQLEGVEEVSSAFQLTTQGKIGDLSADLVAVATAPSFLRLGGFKTDQGEALTDEDKGKIVVSSSVPQLFGKEINEIMDQKIKFTFFILQEGQSEENAQSNFKEVNFDKEYKIAGVIKEESNVIYINSSSLEDLKIDRYTQLKVKCHSSGEMEQVREKIMDYGLLVSSLSDTVDQANKIFQIIQLVLMLFGIIALIVSAIGMFNTMTITLLERTEEIGIMKSIGATDFAISLMFIMESAIMGLSGGLIGVGIGVGGGKIFNIVINIIAVRFGGEPINLFSSPPWFIPTIIIFATVVGLITSLVPARRASGIDPLDALRYK